MFLFKLHELDTLLKRLESEYSNRTKQQSRALQTVMLEVAERIHNAELERKQIKADEERELAEETGDGWVNRP